MRNFMIYLFILVFSIFFISCSKNSLDVTKEKNSIIFYDANLKVKQINLDESGIILNIQTFNNEKLETEWIPDNNNLEEFYEYYGNGKVKVKGYLKNNKKHSLWSYYDREGHLLIERYFSYDMPNNIWIWYDHHGHHKIDKYKIYSDIRNDGSFTRYYQSSNIKEKKNYVYNKLDGEYNLFHDSEANSIYLKGYYLAGAKINDWEIFNEQGEFQAFLK